MGTIGKLILGGLAIFLAVGGPRHLKKGNPDEAGQPSRPPVENRRNPPPAAPADRPAAQPLTGLTGNFAGQPANLITSLTWLEENGTLKVEMQEAHLTYYLLARSDRCSIDSLESCIKDAVLAGGIDPRDFQYTYFFDRVMIAGSGKLFWEGKAYLVNYAALRQAGWTDGTRNFKNNYRCAGFSFRSKDPVAFIHQNLADKKVFVPVDESPYPNGATVSGQGAMDWLTVSINPQNFPLSVPDARRRASLQQRYADKKYWPPEERSFIVLVAKDGRMFLTEAADTGSGVKENSIDWRIGNSSAEIKYFFTVGPVVRALCYTFKDANLTIAKVLANSNPVASR